MKIKYRTLSAALTLIYLVSLVPMLLIARYNYPSADDFTMGLAVHHAYLEGGLSGAIAEDIHHTLELFQQWMGYFTSNLFMCMPPNVFGEQYYKWSTVILLVILTGGVLIFMRVLFVRLLGTSGDIAHILGILYLLICVQCMPAGMARVEAFYWYSGAINYAGTYAICLVYLALLFYVAYGSGNGRKTAGYIVLLLISFWIGGANYMTALTCAFITGMYLLALTPPGQKWLLKRGCIRETSEEAGGRKFRKATILPCILMLIGFAYSCAAPGNENREATLQGFSAVKSVLISLYYGLTYSVNLWLRWEAVLILVMMIPFLWKAASDSKLSFRVPGVVSLLLYGIVSMNYTPPLYALGNVLAGRLRSLMWMQFILAVMLAMYYWFGWAQRYVLKLHEGREESGPVQTVTGGSLLSGGTVKLLAVCAGFLVFGSVLCIKAEPDYYTSTTAMVDLLNGHAKVYAEENAVREALLHDPDNLDVVLQEFTYKPDLLFFEDITEDPHGWINDGVARYYFKNSVRLELKEKDEEKDKDE